MGKPVCNDASGSGDFANQIQKAVAGTGLSAFDVAARARFAGSCMGCHQEASGSSLGNGLAAPFQGDFVHVSEVAIEDCGDGSACFGLSNALRDVFVPHRLDVQARLLEGPSACGGGGEADGGTAGTGGATGGGSSGGGVGELPPPVTTPPESPGLDRSPVRLTLGGQLVVSHSH